MSSCGVDVPTPEQLCYIPCNFCNIVLAVSVPCSSMLDIVTVRCGHCTNLWSVNMASLSSLHSISSPWPDFHNPQAPNYTNSAGINRSNSMVGSSASMYNNTNHTTNLNSSPTNPPQERIINRPPEKRQRVPSAYNQFIKEEIQRIKSNNPDISHREAFSTAAKNWAHFPHIHFGLMLETNNQPKLDEGSQKHLMQRAAF